MLMYFQPGAAPCRNLVIYGTEATGKSAVTTALLDALADRPEHDSEDADFSLKHAIVNSVEFITARHLYESVVAKVAQALAWDAAPSRCETVSQLTVELCRMLKYTPRADHFRFVLVFDGVDRQRDAPRTLFPALARLSEIVSPQSITPKVPHPPLTVFHRSPPSQLSSLSPPHLLISSSPPRSPTSTSQPTPNRTSSPSSPSPRLQPYPTPPSKKPPTSGRASPPPSTTPSPAPPPAPSRPSPTPAPPSGRASRRPSTPAPTRHASSPSSSSRHAPTSRTNASSTQASSPRPQPPLEAPPNQPPPSHKQQQHLPAQAPTSPPSSQQPRACSSSPPT